MICQMWGTRCSSWIILKNSDSRFYCDGIEKLVIQVDKCLYKKIRIV